MAAVEPLETASHVVSATGKVMVTGGYLVLRPPKAALVLSTTARFYTSVQWAALDAAVPSDGDDKVAVTLESPQFHKTSRFSLGFGGDGILFERLSDTDANMYVERTVDVVMGVVEQALGEKLYATLRRARSEGKQLAITLLADNDFYSQSSHLRDAGLPMTRSSLATLPPCLPCPTLDDGSVVVNKTGMGSSAALITSLAGALLSFWGIVCMNSVDSSLSSSTTIVTDREQATMLIHHCAQVAHGLAQGKVGSGFDVCAACYGSMRYTRVSTEQLRKHMNACDSSDPSVRQAEFKELLTTTSPWDYSVGRFELPPHLGLLMADVRGGSETPSMVRKVLAWLDGGGEDAAALWDEVNASNERVEEIFQDLHRLHANNPTCYDESMIAMSSGDIVGESEVCGAIHKLRRAFRATRRLLKQMGEAAGVPIEPDQQTSLADAVSDVPGVVMCGVPGAGGNDALFVIFVQGPETETAIEKQLASFSESTEATICPLSLREGKSAAATDSEVARKVEVDESAGQPGVRRELRLPTELTPTS